MVGYLTALLFTLILIATIHVRQHERFIVRSPQPDFNSGYSDFMSNDYETLMEAYKKAFMASKITGDQTSLIQVQSAIEEYQDAMREQITQNQFYIQTFLDDYQDANPELDTLHKKAQQLQNEGPAIADQLVASTKEIPPQIDYTSLITRVVVLALLIGVAVAVQTFS
jgi:hypothetical protein